MVTTRSQRTNQTGAPPHAAADVVDETQENNENNNDMPPQHNNGHQNDINEAPQNNEDAPQNQLLFSTFLKKFIMYGFIILCFFNFVEIDWLVDTKNAAYKEYEKVMSSTYNEELDMNIKQETLSQARDRYSTNKTQSNKNHLDRQKAAYNEARNKLQSIHDKAKQKIGIFSTICFDEIGSKYIERIKAKPNLYHHCELVGKGYVEVPDICDAMSRFILGNFQFIMHDVYQIYQSYQDPDVWYSPFSIIFFFVNAIAAVSAAMSVIAAALTPLYLIITLLVHRRRRVRQGVAV